MVGHVIEGNPARAVRGLPDSTIDRDDDVALDEVGAHPCGFGSSQSTSTVAFAGTIASPITWSDTQITAVVPAEAANGAVSVTVASLGVEGPSFTINATFQLTDSLGNQTIYTATSIGGKWYVYDAQGSGCSSCSLRGTIHYGYDSKGNILSETDELGRTSTYTYDSANNLTSESKQLDAGTTATTFYTYNSFGEVLTVTDPLGNTTTNAYDTKGNLLSVTSPVPDGNTAASVTQFAYDSKGQLTQITDPLGRITTLTYTAQGLIASITDQQQHTTNYQYDAHGNRTVVIDAAQNQTTFAYDAGDRLAGITYTGGSSVGFTYDSRGRRTSVQDQNGKITHYTYDDADRLTAVTDDPGNSTQYAYDTENNLLSITDANGHQTSFTYDAFGRVAQSAFPSSLAESYIYDAVGNLTSKTDRKGQTILYVYDALNRLTHKGYPDSTGVDYVYDLVGKIQQVTDPTGTYGFAYDNMGRLIGTTTQYAFLPGHTYTNSYAYDAASNRTSLTAPDGSTNSYQYDTLNRLTTLTNSLTGQFTFGYDALSRRTSLTRPNGINTSYSYDSLSRLLSVLHQAGGVTVDGASYNYDSAGNRTSKTNLLNGITEDYTYDAIYQLLQVTQGATTTESYSYDAVGNRLSSLGVLPYVYNSSNQLTSTPGMTYTYDDNGNTLTKADTSGTTQYAWDVENRLTSVMLPDTGNGATVVTFKYDPFGRRIEKSGPSGTTNYLYDGKDLLEEIDNNGSVLARYTEGSRVDEWLAELRAGTASYFQGDGLGSATSLSNSSGALAKTYTYDAFGKVIASTGTLTNPLQYTGREFDAETGLQYNRARYYDSGAGRFLSEDPLGFNAENNFYGYVENNPVGYTDPSGLCCTSPVSPWTEAEELAYQAYVRSLQGTSRFLSRLGAGAMVAGYLLDPSSENNARWANSQEYQFEKKCREKQECQKASDWHLSHVGITDPHEFKKDYLGNKAPISQYDICACKDGSIVIKKQGQCGQPGPSIDTGVRWK